MRMLLNDDYNQVVEQDNSQELAPFDLELFNKSMFDDNSFEKIRRKDKRPRYEKKQF